MKNANTLKKLSFKVSLKLSILVLLTACHSRAIIDLSPKYQPDTLIVPEKWHGRSPFKLAEPSDTEICRGEWWKVFDDTVLNRLQEDFHHNNPELHAAAERFIQSRYEMMKVRSEYLPHIGLNGDYYKNQRSMDDLLNGQVNEFAPSNTASLAGLVSWEPDIWSRFRNATTIKVYQSQESAADYAAIRLMLQAELAADYFTLRGLDNQNAIYLKAITYFKRSLFMVETRFRGKLASRLDVARAKYILARTQAKQLKVQTQREIVEHAIAILLNTSPSVFHIQPRPLFPIPKAKIPDVLPASLAERRPDIAALERKMAEANKAIGIARAAFFPLLNLGSRDTLFFMSKISNIVWATGSLINFTAFQAGYRRAQLKKSWSKYRETLNNYRAGILNAFREVENNLSKTNLYNKQLKRQKEAVDAAYEAQKLTMELFLGRLTSSLALLYADIYTLEARIQEAKIKVDLMVSVVMLIKSLGGGWDQHLLPEDREIQPFNTLQYHNLDNLKPAGNIHKTNPKCHASLIGKPCTPDVDK